MEIAEFVDLDEVKMKVEYSASDPKVIEDSSDPPAPDEGHLRLWLKDGNEQRSEKGVDNGGDFIAGEGGRIYDDLTEFGFSKQKRTVEFFLEGIRQSDREGDLRIKFSIDIDEDTEYELTDTVRVTSVDIDIVATDVTGFKGIGTTPPEEVPRVPSDQHPDGIATDGSLKADDGALLLFRLVVPKFLGNDIIGRLSASWGHINKPFDDFNDVDNADPEFKELPVSPDQEGEFKALNNISELAISELGLALPGESFEKNNEKLVEAARIYKPPIEFNREEPEDDRKLRNLFIASKILFSDRQFCTSTRKTALVRPPLVLVHGVNSGPDVWKTAKDGVNFLKNFDTGPLDYGFVAEPFRVDHSITDPERKSEGSTLGFGEISSMFEEVSQVVSGAVTSFHENIQTFGTDEERRIAVQKVDIVAHSYGGLLTRWYTERARENPGDIPGSIFDDRRDVRKIITLGTPHKGTPLANFISEAFDSLDNGIIRNAKIEGVYGVQPTVEELLNIIDIDSHAQDNKEDTKLKLLKPLEGRLPNALTPARISPRHAYQVMAVNSERLQQLNTPPFRDSIQYAAVIGTQRSFDVVEDKDLPSPADVAEPFDDFIPVTDSFFKEEKSYFPWLSKFDTDPSVTREIGNDSVVPTWSARVGTKLNDPFNLTVEEEHIRLVQESVVQEKIRFWLNRPLPHGATQRNRTNMEPPISIQNAYDGSTVIGDISKGAGLNQDAIVKLEVTSQDPFQKIFSIPNDTGAEDVPEGVGIEDVRLTGMIRERNLDADFTVVADEINDETLDKITPDGIETFELSQRQLDRSGRDDFVSFGLPTGRIGRRRTQKITGPDGDSENTSRLEPFTKFVGYELKGGGLSINRRQQRFLYLNLRCRHLKRPVKMA